MPRQLKPLRQYDGFLNVEADSVTHPDSDNDQLMAETTYELMRGASVRILIDPSLTPKQAARLLRKITNWIKEDGFARVAFSPRSFVTQESSGNEEIPF
jgi:hypothetical protein